MVYSDITTKEIMKIETENILKKEQTIFGILSITTLAFIIITIKYIQK